MRPRTLLLAALLSLSVAPPAAAQDKALAESLFRAGLDLMAKSQWAEAEVKLQASADADRSIGTLAKLAECQEKQGKIASAWASYNDATSAGLAKNDPRAKLTADLAKKLEPKLSYLTIVAKSLPDGASVRRDGKEVSRGALGTPIAADPGKREVRVEAPGHKPWIGSVDVGAAGDKKTLEVPALEKLPEDAKQPPGGGGAGGGGGGGPAEPPKKNDTTGLLVGGLVSIGVGVGALAAGGALGGLAIADRDKALGDPALCPDKQCTPAGRQLLNEADGKALGSTILIPVGATAAVVGVVLTILSATSGGPAKKGALPQRFAVLPAARVSRRDTTG